MIRSGNVFAVEIDRHQRSGATAVSGGTYIFKNEPWPFRSIRARPHENVVRATKSHVVVASRRVLYFRPNRRCFSITAKDGKTGQKRDVPPGVIAAGGFFFRAPRQWRDVRRLLSASRAPRRVIRATRYVIKSTGNRTESALFPALITRSPRHCYHYSD